ncbi:hypothetical protein N9N67_06070 [Bacteriovoracaceae bacterium]|nr:hypothetical protein [Bacteriovoracaceae bacterium]
MVKIILYISILLLYIILAKGFSPNQFGVKYVNNLNDISNLIEKAPASMYLIDQHSIGTFVKTYYQKYRIVYGDQTYRDLIVRVSSDFSQKSNRYIGMSLVNIENDEDPPILTPLPPGSIFLNNTKYGRWIYEKKKEDFKWKFYSQYRLLPKLFGWDYFTPNKQFLNKLNEHIKNKRAYWGNNNEFGPNGKVTNDNFPDYFKRNSIEEINIQSYFDEVLKLNYNL